MTEDTKKPYSTPSIEDMGAVADLTEANKFVTLVDAGFTAGQQPTGS